MRRIDLASVVADALAGRTTRTLEGYSVEYGGQFNQRRATILIAVLAVISFVGMFLVLFMLYPSWRIVLQVLNALPIAFVGGVRRALHWPTLTVARWSASSRSAGSRHNGILLVSHYFHLMRHGARLHGW